MKATRLFKIKFFSLCSFILGEELVNRMYAYHCIRLFKRKKVIFIHIPKTAGVSISKAIYGKGVGHFYGSEIRLLLGFSFFNSMYSFSIVRNPYDRLVSAFHFIIQNGTKDGAIKNNSEFNKFNSKDFESFIKEWLVHQNPDKINIIFRPQNLFIVDGNSEFIVKKVFKFEEMNITISHLSEIVNRKINLKKLNRSSHKAFLNYYNAETSQLVYNFYRKDFILFSYPKLVYY